MKIRNVFYLNNAHYNTPFDAPNERRHSNPRANEILSDVTRIYMLIAIDKASRYEITRAIRADLEIDRSSYSFERDLRPSVKLTGTRCEASASPSLLPRDCSMAPSLAIALALIECVLLSARSLFAKRFWDRLCSFLPGSFQLLFLTRLPYVFPKRVATRSSDSRRFCQFSD